MNGTADNGQASTKDKRKKGGYICPYEKCMLPQNKSGKYVFQTLYLLAASIYMQMDVANYTLLSIALFIIPILLDLWYADSKNWIWKVLRGFVFLVAVFLFAVALMWELQVLGYQTVDQCFVVNASSDLLAGASIPKKLISHLLVALSFYPIVLYFGTPSVADSEILNYTVLNE